MLRWLGVIAALLLLAVTFPTTPASASVEWCWDDPVVTIGGRTVSINVGVQGEPAAVRRNVDAADVVILVPENVPTAVLRTSKRYFQESVTFVTRQGARASAAAIPVEIRVTFRAASAMPAAVQTSYPGGTATASGTTAGQITQHLTLR